MSPSDSVRACFVHLTFQRHCPDCQSLANSIYLSLVNAIRRGVPTPAEQAVYDQMRDDYANRGPEDRGPEDDEDEFVTIPVSDPEKLLEIVETWVRGDVT